MQCYYEKQRDRHRIMLDHFCMPIEVALSLAAKLESAIMSCKLAIEEDARQDNIEASNSAVGKKGKVSLPSGTQHTHEAIGLIKELRQMIVTINPGYVTIR